MSDGKTIYEGFSKTGIKYDALTGVYTFMDPETSSRLHLKAECSVNTSKRKDYERHDPD